MRSNRATPYERRLVAPRGRDGQQSMRINVHTAVALALGLGPVLGCSRIDELLDRSQDAADATSVAPTPRPRRPRTPNAAAHLPSPGTVDPEPDEADDAGIMPDDDAAMAPGADEADGAVAA